MDYQINRRSIKSNYINLIIVVNHNEEDLLKTESYDSDKEEPADQIEEHEEPNQPTCEKTNKRRRVIHANFQLLKKTLKLENFMRKTQMDSLLKKCKSKVFKTIHEALKKCLTIKLPRLPQKFITNIKIDFNKNYLEKTILEIYKEHKIIPSIEDFQNKKYLIEDKLEVFKDFLALTFKDVFEFYLNSKQYVKDYYNIGLREGENFAILFNYISKVFIQYYIKSKGNQPKLIKYKENSLESFKNKDTLEENIYKTTTIQVKKDQIKTSASKRKILKAIKIVKTVNTVNYEKNVNTKQNTNKIFNIKKVKSSINENNA